MKSGAYYSARFDDWSPTITAKLQPEKPAIILCKAGIRSMRMAEVKYICSLRQLDHVQDSSSLLVQYLQSIGFQTLLNVSGGIHAYSMLDPSVPHY
jgi:hypothetical protein